MQHTCSKEWVLFEVVGILAHVAVVPKSVASNRVWEGCSSASALAIQRQPLLGECPQFSLFPPSN